MAVLAIALCAICACKKKDQIVDPPPPTTYKVIEIVTAKGTMYMWLHKETPLHKANFLKLAAEGFYDNTTFHRVIPLFVIQGGDPNSKDADSTNDGTGGPGYTIPAEFHDSLKHVFGAVGAARDNNPAKASNGSQFYIVVDPNGEPSLNALYTVFGQVIGGMPAATAISNTPRNSADRPKTAQTMDVNVVEMTLARLKADFGFVPRL